MKQLLSYIILFILVVFHQIDTTFAFSPFPPLKPLEINSIEKDFSDSVKEVEVIEDGQGGSYRDITSSKHRRFSVGVSVKSILSGTSYLCNFKKTELCLFNYTGIAFSNTSYSKSQYVRLVGIVKNIN